MQSQKGSAVVECALVLVPLLILLFSGIECAFALQRIHEIQRATYSSARLLSLSQSGDLKAIHSAQCLVMTGAPADSMSQCLGQSLLENIDESNVQICDATLCPGSQHIFLTSGQHLNLVTVTTQGMTMNIFPDWVTTILFPSIHISMVQSLS